MEFASQIHTLNTVLATNDINPSALISPNGGWWPRHCSCHTREPELSAKDRVCRAGGTDPTGVTWDPQMLSRDDTHRVQDAAVQRAALFHNNTTVIVRFWIQGCPIPGSVPGYVG